MIIRILLNTVILSLSGVVVCLLYVLIIGRFFVVSGGKGYSIDAPEQVRLFAGLFMVIVLAFIRVLWLARRRIKR